MECPDRTVTIARNSLLLYPREEVLHGKHILIEELVDDDTLMSLTGHFSVGWDVDANLILAPRKLQHIVATYTVYCDKRVGTQNNGCMPHSQALRPCR